MKSTYSHRATLRSAASRRRRCWIDRSRGPVGGADRAGWRSHHRPVRAPVGRIRRTWAPAADDAQLTVTLATAERPAD